MSSRIELPVKREARPDLASDQAREQDPTSRHQLAGELLTNMASVRRAGRRHAGRPIELSTLTGAQLELLKLVRRRRGVSIAEAAQELRLAPNTVSTLVRQLTEQGMMRRRVHGSDRRVAQLELSADIRRKVDAWRDRRVLALGGALGQLSRQEQRTLSEAAPVLASLAERLEAQEADQ